MLSVYDITEALKQINIYSITSLFKLLFQAVVLQSQSYVTL